jgi:hypothetical protein
MEWDIDGRVSNSQTERRLGTLLYVDCSRYVGGFHTGADFAVLQPIRRTQGSSRFMYEQSKAAVAGNPDV